ncbi:response regulator transcription factor [Microbacterium sp. A93]|uniref:response regulator transcription factor n=1 Tax=Microbacterium sp. A93 TaxID=3450716 RepID=UPI003F421D84
MRVTSAIGRAKEGTLLEVMEIVQSDAALDDRRLLMGQKLLELLRAEVFVSYTHGPDGPFSDPVGVNLGAASIQAYDDHFRFVDGITPALSKRMGAVRVSPPRHSKDEFIRDFLHQRDMHHGMNFFARTPAPGKVDLRVWRDRSAGAFSDHDVRLLEGVGGLIERLWSATVTVAPIALTPREREVAGLVAEGMSDQQICSVLRITLPTLRTHLSHAFAKVGVQNRAGLAAYYVRIIINDDGTDMTDRRSWV